MPGVSTSEGQWNPAPRCTALTATQLCVLGSWVPRGKSQVLCAVFITRGQHPGDPQNLLEGFSKNPFASSFTQTPTFCGGWGSHPKRSPLSLTPFLPQSIQSARNCIWHLTDTLELSPPSCLLPGPQAPGTEMQASMEWTRLKCSDTGDQVLEAKAWSE